MPVSFLPVLGPAGKSGASGWHEGVVTQPGQWFVTLPPMSTEEGQSLRDCPVNFLTAQMRKLRLRERKAFTQRLHNSLMEEQGLRIRTQVS